MTSTITPTKSTGGGIRTPALSAGQKPRSSALVPGSFQDWTLLSLAPVQTQSIPMNFSEIRQLKLAPRLEMWQYLQHAVPVLGSANSQLPLAVRFTLPAPLLPGDP